MSETADTGAAAPEPDPQHIAAVWLERFAGALARRDLEAVDALFLPDGWWRDLLALTWDLRTFHGPERIRPMLDDHLDGAGLRGIALTAGKAPSLQTPGPELQWVEAFYDFETAVGRGRGVVRLRRDAAGAWKAWTLLTALQELHGFEPARGPRRPVGPRSGGDGDEEHWLTRRRHERAFADREPRVLVIGAGQGGLAIAANLGIIGVDTLVVEQNARIGDNWRQRYRSLVLHDPVWADHLPYLPFPDSWPVYTPKDKLAAWFEHYAEAMELNVWTGTQLLGGAYDDATGEWSVQVRLADGVERTLRPAHVILATGALGAPNVPRIEGAEDFTGTLLHSGAFAGGEGWEGRRAVVIGTGNSGHDIAQELYEHGADVTLVQRSTTYIMTQQHGIPVLFGGLYYEGGPPVEDADLLNAGYPLPVVLQFAVAQTQAIAELDRDLHAGLERAGFRLDDGIDGGGLMSKALAHGGGYYIDVGCSQLIVDGKVKLKSAGVERLTPAGVRFDDGSTLEADVVVLATGYGNMRETARRLFGADVASRCTPVWGLDDEGEINTLWRNSGHPALWFMGGPLVMARIYSRYLALQLKGLEEGLFAHPALTPRT